MSHEDNKPVNLFWTGGWDSSFRLLQLVLVEMRKVQPYYLIDPKRQSLRNEINARRDIKERLFKEYPHTRELILPTQFYEVGDIAPDNEITEAYNAYRKDKEVDFQYSWLARFCKQQQIHDMELCIESRSGYSVSPERIVFSSFLVLVDGTREARIADEFKGTVIETIFQWFHFPIRGYTRQDMEAEAKAGGWADYLFMTWFCLSPVKGRYPCGTCDPCKLAIKKGYGKRIPWHRRLYAKLGLEKVRQKGARLVRKIDPKFHQWKK